MEANEEFIKTWTSPTLTYFAVTLGLIALVKYFFASGVPDNIPPLPAKPYSFLGHLPYLSKDMRQQMTEWTKSTGEIFSLYFGTKLVIILSSYDVLHKAYVGHAETLSDRPPTVGGTFGDEEPNRGVASSSGKLWKEQRSVAMQILRAFGMGKNIFASKVSEEVSAYIHALSELYGEPADVRSLTQTAVSNVICSIIVGKRFEYDDEYFITFINKLDELFRLSGGFSLFTMFPWLRHLPGDFFKAKRRLGLYQYIHDFFCKSYINKTKNEDVELNRENFISAYLLQKKKLEQKGQDTTLDDENLSRTIYELFVAGTDTTATAIRWFMVYMLHYPDIQAKIFAEISDNVGLERQPSMGDKSKLSFLTATIMEVQRVSVTPLNIPHFSTKDTVINGYTIPAGTTLIPFQDSYFFCTDPWKEPTKFKPERFLDTLGNVKQPEKFVPFGIGRRACPGEALAKMELFLFLSSMVQRFELLPAGPGQLPSLTPIEGLVFAPQPFKIRFVDRKNH